MEINNKFSISLAVLAAMLLSGFTLLAQELKPRLSPPASITQTLGEDTQITVSYSRPAVKGRTIWGDLVPYDKVWRTGANEATTFSSNADLIIAGKPLAAGTYALFTVPGQEQWTIIFNKKADQWGSYDYDESLDALRITVTPENAAAAEWLNMSFAALDGHSATLAIHWDKVRLSIPVQTTQKGEEEEVRKSLKGEMAQTIGADTRIALTYSRPGVKGRNIWGSLVPYDKVWRTGANENTVFQTSADVMIEGQKLPAGSYGLHTIPGESQWTIIFSKQDDLWGSGDYDPANDALRVTVNPHAAASATEWMQFSAPALTLSDKQVSAAEIALAWENQVVPFTVSLP